MARQKSTRRVSCARVAAAPVGLLGEQKKTTSVRAARARSGKKSFSGVHAMYSTPAKPVPSCAPVLPSMTVVST